MPKPMQPVPPPSLRVCERIFKCWDCDCHRASKRSRELATMRREIDHIKGHLGFPAAPKEGMS